MTFKFGLRTKLLLLSSFLFTIPWFGYQYVWEMEKYLRFGQEQTLVGTARALATALHERPKLFNNQASFLPNVEQGKDLYGYLLKQAIQLDGLNNDWPNVNERAHFYGQKQPLQTTETDRNTDFNFTAMLGKYDKYLYLFFAVVDNQVNFRGQNTRSIINNDHLEIAYVDQQGQFKRFIISNKQAGWLDAYRVSQIEHDIPVSAKNIQGNWVITPLGYNIELRIPLSDIGDKLAFALHDVRANQQNTIGSADTSNENGLGTILVPSPEIERIVKGMSYSNSRIWVVDQHGRVLASTGDIKKAVGVWQRTIKAEQNNHWLTKFTEQWLHPLYYKILTKPSINFVDQAYDASKLKGQHIVSALQGKAKSQWRLTQDKQAVILSAAYPIYINNQVHGAVIAEETTNGIRTLRNKALEKLFTAIITILLIGALVFFIFASRISNRIRSLRNQAEHAIDQHGRITAEVIPSTAKDEIGDLSRSFASVVKRLSQYNHYLENMSSRLSHELRTPIAVVRTSLENLNLQKMPESANAYIERAQSGINRLSHIITHMSEATRIEQMLQHTEKENVNLTQVINGCLQGYQQIYPTINFEFNNMLTNDGTKNQLNGSPEHIAQLLDKVIANAVEFSEDNKVQINLSRHKNNYHLCISNTGMLLPENMQDKLFESMVSLRPQTKQTQPHLGLGLFIARLITEYHHGSIKANNNYQPKGVTIEIILPVA
jgi:two-component system, OmpR family, sensor histidine kinase ChvG